jgi:hypothetical protein
MYPFKVTPKTCAHNKISKTKGFALMPHWHIMSKRLLGIYQFSKWFEMFQLHAAIPQYMKANWGWAYMMTNPAELADGNHWLTLISQKHEEIWGEPTNAAIEVCSLCPITVNTAHRTMHSDSWREQISFSDCPFMKLEGQLQTSGVLQNSSWNTCADWQQSRSC